MKARVILTGDIIDVIPKFIPKAQHSADDLYACGDKVYYGNQLEFLNTKDSNTDLETSFEISKLSDRELLERIYKLLLSHES